MLSRLIAWWFPDLHRVDELSLHRRIWLSAYDPVRNSPTYWLIALAAQVVGQIAVTVPVSRLLKSRGYYAGYMVWLLPTIVAAVACLVMIWIVRRGITRSLRRELTNRGWPTCVACGYDLTGNETGVCSECGSKVGT